MQGNTSELLDDAGAAAGRVEQAAGTLRKITSEKHATETDLARKGEEIVGAKTVIERRALEQQKREKQKNLLVLDEQMTANQDDLLAAGSPFGKPFDYATDYQSLLHSTPEHEPEPAPVQEIEPKSPLRDTPVEPSTAPVQETASPAISDEENVPAHAPISEAPLSPPSEQRTQVDEQPPVKVNAPSVSTIPASQEIPHSPNDEVYNDRAGDACQAIWQLLAYGRFSMACQLAPAMSAQAGPLSPLALPPGPQTASEAPRRLSPPQRVNSTGSERLQPPSPAAES